MSICLDEQISISIYFGSRTIQMIGSCMHSSTEVELDMLKEYFRV